MYQTKLMGKRHLATLLISVILISTIIAAVGLPIVASGGEQGRTVSGPAEFEATIVDVIADSYVDTDGDGVDDLRITTRRLVLEYTGVLDGTGIALMTITQDLHTNIARASTIINYYGRVGDSEPGAMTMIVTLISDRSGPIYKAHGSIVAVEGTGVGGLEGICGGGTYQVEGPPAGPFTATAYYEFRFHSPFWS